MSTPTLPPGVTTNYFIVQHTDPHRKPAEPPARSMKELDRAAVLARYGWTEDDFTTAVSLTEPCKFPSAQKHKTRPGGYGLVPVWLEHQLQRWEETVAGHVAVLRGLLRK